jgi:hypothetical protein
MKTEGFLMVYTERGHEVAESKYCGSWIPAEPFQGSPDAALSLKRSLETLPGKSERDSSSLSFISLFLSSRQIFGRS